MGERIDQFADKIASKKLFITLFACIIMVWLYLRLDNQFVYFIEGERLVQEKTYLFDKFQWAFVLIVAAYITGDVFDSRMKKKE